MRNNLRIHTSCVWRRGVNREFGMPTTAAALCRAAALRSSRCCSRGRRWRRARWQRAAAPPNRRTSVAPTGRGHRKGCAGRAAYLPLRFEAKFSSPCWRNGSALRCLPRLFLAGAMQCGVPDLWERLRAHALLGALRYDAQAHWWTNHPRSRAGYFERYVSLYSGERTAAALEAEPSVGRRVAGVVYVHDAEELRLHYLYLDAFDNCCRRCRNQKLPRPSPPSAPTARTGWSTAIPRRKRRRCPTSTCRRSSRRCSRARGRWSSRCCASRGAAVDLVLFYGQFPARYGATNAGWLLLWEPERCVRSVRRRARHAAVRAALEAHGPEQAAVYYHCDQLIKG